MLGDEALVFVAGPMHETPQVALLLGEVVKVVVVPKLVNERVLL